MAGAAAEALAPAAEVANSHGAAAGCETGEGDDGLGALVSEDVFFFFLGGVRVEDVFALRCLGIGSGGKEGFGSVK